MADKRIIDYTEAASAGADYYLVTDSASDGVKKIKPANIVPAFTGDVTKAAGGTVTAIANNAVTNAKAAPMAAGTIKSNLTGASASASDNTINAVMDAAFGSTQGAIAYRGASGWSSLAPGVSGQFMQTSGPSANPIWQTIPGGGDMLASTYAQRIVNYDTRAAAIAATIPASQNSIITGGYTAINDGGGANYVRVGASPSHPGKFQTADGAWWEIREKVLNVLMFGAKRDQAGVDSWQAFSDCIATIGAQAIASSYRYGGPLYIPAGQYEVSKAIPPITTPGVRVIGEGGTTSVIKAQAGITGSYILSHSPPVGDTTTIMTGVGVIGVGLDCNEQVIHGYLGEMVYDGVVYDDFRIDRPAASAVGFTLRPRAGNAITVCQTIDIRSLFVGKYTVKGTVPAVLLDNCQEINIWSSKAWNGYGTPSTNKGTAAAWFIQDCRTVTMVGCSAAGSVQAGVQVYANTRSCVGIALINPLFENLDVNFYVDSSTPASWNNTDISIYNPRHESPTGGYIIKSTVRGHIEVINAAVSLDANTSSVEVLANTLSQITDSGTNNMRRSREVATIAYTPTQSGTAPGTASGNISYFDKKAYVSLRFAATGTGTVVLSLPTGINAASFGNQTLFGFDAGIDGSIIYGHIGPGAHVVTFEKSGAYGTGFAANTGNYQIDGELFLA